MELVNTGRRVQNPLQHKGFRRFQSCRHRPQQTRKCQVRTRLEITGFKRKLTVKKCSKINASGVRRRSGGNRFSPECLSKNRETKIKINIRSGIEVVVTSRTRNAVVRKRARGFKSHPLRQRRCFVRFFAEAAPFFRCYPGSGFDSGTKSRLVTSVSAELSFAV